MSTLTTNPMHHIHRNPGDHAWSLLVTKKGRQQQHLFKDKHGHPGHSLAATLNYRDEHYPELAGSRTAHGLGVHLKPSTIKGKEYVSFGAHWTDETGRRHTSYFAVGRYGFNEALRRACQARFDAVGGRSYYEDMDQLFEAALANFANERAVMTIGTRRCTMDVTTPPLPHSRYAANHQRACPDERPR